MSSSPSPSPAGNELNDEIMTEDSGDSSEYEEKESGICQGLKDLFTNAPYILLCLSLTFLYFVITGIQYWVSDYLIETLKVTRNQVFVTFAIVSITGPVFGVIIGGNVTTYLGGYNSKHALYLSMGTAVLCVFSAAPIPFISNFPLFVVLLWFLLFFGGAILPCMTGIMLNTVPKSLKTTANSIANLSYNLIGYLPAPSIYGLIYDSGEGKNAREAMATLMFTPTLSVIFLFTGAYYIVKNDILNYKL